METTVAKPKQQIQPAVKAPSLERDMLLIENKYPTKEGLRRRIHHLWDHFFRVNYHNLTNGNIPESHFIFISADNTIEEK